MTTERARTISLCGGVDLLAAIFRGDRDKLRIQYGLPPSYPICEQCRQRLPVVNKKSKLRVSGFCSVACRRQYNLIQVACDECGKLFERDARTLVHDIGKDGYQHTFCNRRCLGHYAARHYGFIAHPENCYTTGNTRKWDWDMVWSKHLETGFGSWRLGRILGIPYSTVDIILAKKRKGTLTTKPKCASLCQGHNELRKVFTRGTEAKQEAKKVFPKAPYDSGKVREEV